MVQRRRPGYRYWFPARNYGWGWGMPRTWQGWLVLDIYLGLIIMGLFITLFGGGGNVFFGIFMIVFATGILIWVCYKKGEPQHRR